MSQNPYLLNDTILNNITFGENQENINDQNFLKEVCNISRVTEFSNNFKNGLKQKLLKMDQFIWRSETKNKYC